MRSNPILLKWVLRRERFLYCILLYVSGIYNKHNFLAFHCKFKKSKNKYNEWNMREWHTAAFSPPRVYPLRGRLCTSQQEFKNMGVTERELLYCLLETPNASICEEQFYFLRCCSRHDSHFFLKKSSSGSSICTEPNPNLHVSWPHPTLFIASLLISRGKKNQYLTVFLGIKHDLENLQ